jgi:hypothetical protein
MKNKRAISNLFTLIRLQEALKMVSVFMGTKLSSGWRKTQQTW